MNVAYAFRVFIVILQGVGVLALWALFNLGVSIRDDTREIKKEWPEVKKNIGTLITDVGDLKANAATKNELKEAETRVKLEFIQQLKKQSKARLVTPD